jgi:CHRD domain
LDPALENDAFREEIMRRQNLTAAALIATVAVFSASYACAEEFTAHLTGFNEIGSIPTIVTVTALGAAAPTGYTGAILTDATGTLELDLDKKAGQIGYTLTYTGPFTSDVQQAHIHFGKSHDSGGIVVWLCQTTAKPAPAQVAMITPTCPTPSPTATVKGTITLDNVLAVPGQNVTAKDFDAITDAITSHTAYANIHTANFQGGEIRGQVHAVERDHDHDQNHR